MKRKRNDEGIATKDCDDKTPATTTSPVALWAFWACFYYSEQIVVGWPTTPDVLLGFLPFQKMALLAKACSIMPGFVYQYAREQAETYGLEPNDKERPYDLLYALSHHFPNERPAYRHLKPFEFGLEWDTEEAKFGYEERAQLNTRQNCISYIKDEEGTVYTWGNGSAGLGHGDLINRRFPTKVEGLGGKVAREVKMGVQHTAVLFTNGEVAVWGWNDKGQLGLDDDESELVLTPQFVKFLRGHRVVDIKVGLSSTFFLTSERRLFVTGANTSNCLGPCSVMGQNYESFKYRKPTEMTREDIKGRVIAICVRKNSTRVYVNSIERKNKRKRGE